MSIRLDDAELDALFGAVAELWKFYIVLRKAMDFRTGLVSGISWRTLQYEMTVTPGQGLTDTGDPCKAKLRRLAERAERAGLLENRSTDKCLSFFLCKANRDDSARKKPGTKPAQSRHTDPGTSAHSNGAVLCDELEETRHPPKAKGSAKPGTIPVSGIRKEVIPPLPPEPLLANVDLGAWEDFVQHRKEIRHPLTPKAAALNLKALAQVPLAEQRGLVDKIIAMGWRGIQGPASYAGGRDGNATGRQSATARFHALNLADFRRATGGGGAS